MPLGLVMLSSVIFFYGRSISIAGCAVNDLEQLHERP